MSILSFFVFCRLKCGKGLCCGGVCCKLTCKLMIVGILCGNVGNNDVDCRVGSEPRSGNQLLNGPDDQSVESVSGVSILGPYTTHQPRGTAVSPGLSREH